MTIRAEVYQFLARHNLPDRPLCTRDTYPEQRCDIRIRVEYRVCPKPFSINFAHVIASQPSIGVHEPVDEIIDKYMSKRWPKCIKGTAEITSPANDLRNSDTFGKILLYLRLHLWTRNNKQECSDFFDAIHDQLSTTEGYRREYFHRQLYDIDGNRRPSSSRGFVPTEKEEYVGPGLACFLNVDAFDGINELVWSSIIPFRNRTNHIDDLPAIERKLTDIRKHFNSYSELEDARRLLAQGEIKSSIRSAASSIDAILRFYCSLWDTSFPSGSLPFDEKIEKVLAEAGKPSYRSADPINLEKLLYLYRARNSMHEGDCYYRDLEGNTYHIGDESQAEPFVDAAEYFTIWIDAVV